MIAVLYQRHAVNILDDPYSAVDPDVAVEMHQRGCEGRLAGTTRILVVSARLELLASAALVIRLGKDGKVSACGPPADVLSECAEGSPQLAATHSAPVTPTSDQIGSEIKQTEEEEKADEAGRSLTVQEDREEGVVSSSVYLTYFSYAVAGKGALVAGGIIGACKFSSTESSPPVACEF